MELSGVIKLINETKTYGEKGFRKREAVLTIPDEKYPQHILVEFIQDKCDLLDNFAEGQEVKISININGRIWISPEGEEKYFNSLIGWRIESTGEAGNTQQPQGNQPAPEPEDDNNDLPFN